MAPLSDEMLNVARTRMSRAEKRLNGAAVAATRKDIAEGEFDNHFDGVVSAILHIADAVELVRTGVHRKVGEGEAATVIRSGIATLTADQIDSVPAPVTLIDLNGRRNTTVHGHWTEVLDRDALGRCDSCRSPVPRRRRIYIERRGVAPRGA